MNKPILCLDFDGVLHSYTSGWQGARNIPDPPVAGAIDWLIHAMEKFEVHILSSRSHQWFGRWSMKSWLRYHVKEYLWERCTEIDVAGMPVSLADIVANQPWTGLDLETHVRIAARQIVRRIHFPKHKPAAKVTIDDRALTFTGKWPSLIALERFQPWNKKA